jgi:hypothetical protein
MENIKHKIMRFRAKWSLINRYEYLNAIDELMEEYITAQILSSSGEAFLKESRSKLLETQGRMREQQKLVDFLRTK